MQGRWTHLQMKLKPQCRNGAAKKALTLSWELSFFAKIESLGSLVTDQKIIRC